MPQLPIHSLLILLLLVGYSCSNSTDSGDGNGTPPGTVSYEVEPAFPNLSFSRPLYLDHAGDGSDRLFVVEQSGIIQVFENNASTSNRSVFLDIQDRVDDSGNEEGLLGLAFHPDYANNGFFYVNYTADNQTIISRFEVSGSNPDQADSGSETVILTYNQPFSNHNGGHLAFGPDGYLYIASGDGGSGGDPDENAQNLKTLLGNILRIDVDGSENGNNYAIPPDNPFAGNSEGFREEIFAYGLRNPWRFSFDSENGDLLAGDVGQSELEEIDIIVNGGNYGWNTFEGTACFDPDPELDCESTDVEFPIWEYGQDGSQSVTGGYVYRGPALGELTGTYIYADFITGRIWGLDISDPDNPSNTELIDSELNISSFGTDADDELYICSFDGQIYRLLETE